MPPPLVAVRLLNKQITCRTSSSKPTTGADASRRNPRTAGESTDCAAGLPGGNPA